ncbi:hypothetical protein [Geobacillus jurassicus]|uniref:Uncharacterized protein n=1 Tax=Geobacillus jurassicus TaxID=235932 RepID=A0ABV6GRT3_9BACL|nr:hypothetical protein [Geobacillus jurassicus]
MNKKRSFAPSYESDEVMGVKSKNKPPRRSNHDQSAGKQAPDFFNTTPSSE